MKDTNLTTIYQAGNQIEAEIVKARLESAGIPALLKYESLGQVYGLTVDGLGQVEVQVPAECAEDAEKLLDSNAPYDEGMDEPGSSRCPGPH